MATMTLNMTDREMEVLTELATSKGITKTALMKQALRIYQMVDVKLARGETMMFSGDKGKLYESMIVT